MQECTDNGTTRQITGYPSTRWHSLTTLTLPTAGQLTNQCGGDGEITGHIEPVFHNSEGRIDDVEGETAQVGWHVEDDSLAESVVGQFLEQLLSKISQIVEGVLRQTESSSPVGELQLGDFSRARDSVALDLGSDDHSGGDGNSSDL